MKIRVIRGQNQIGGSVIEVCSGGTRIILDAGSELDEETPQIPAIDGLFQGNPGYDAVFVTHYHGDHIGLATDVLPEIPVFMGEKAAAVHQAANAYMGKKYVQTDHFLRSEESVTVGEIKVTPFLCDHSAFDSYMLLLECEGKKVLYTGDFRANGRKSFPSLLRCLDEVDVLISEGTTLNRPTGAVITETELEHEALEAISKTDGPVFIFMAATNIDRIVTAYKAARKAGRVFLQDVYTASITATAGGNIPNPRSFGAVRVFLTHPRDKQYHILNQFPAAKIGRAGIAKQRFLMCIRPSMTKYLEKLSELVPFNGGVMFYSMWSGYKQKDDVAAFLDFMRGKGVAIVDLHTSGHADANTIDALVADVKPKYVIPVHTENAGWFDRYENCCVIHDGEIEL